MRIKTKIFGGLLLLFLMVLTLTFIGVYNLHGIRNDMRGILLDNFKSVGFTRNMLQSLDEIRALVDITVESGELRVERYSSFSTLNSPHSTVLTTKVAVFEKNLVAQENNITEIGEKELTDSVKMRFEALRTLIDSCQSSVVSPELYQKLSTINYQLSTNLYAISDLNSNAIIAKNNYAENRAQKGVFLVSLIAAFCLITSFTFLINFPGFIANPITALTEGIKEIANKNYHKRIHFKTNDEFGELSLAFNAMAQRLYDYENSNLENIISEKKRVETIIDTIQDPLIVLSEKNYILFVNTQAEAILGLKKAELTGKYAPDIALKNDLLRHLLNSDSDKPVKIFFGEKESYFDNKLFDIKSDEKNYGKVIVLRNITMFHERDLKNENLIAAIRNQVSG